jgi:hypothetical protein
MTSRLYMAFVFALAASFALDALAFTTQDLQRLLKAGARPTVSFQEVRESPWLAAPVVSTGTMRSTPGVLEKHVESPSRETWRLLDDRVEWQAAGGSTKQILFSQAPALGALSGLMRRVVAGDLTSLQREFDIRVSGDEHAWRAQLVPRDAQIRQQLESVEVQGTGGAVQVLIVTDRQGEKTTTRFQP